MQDNPDWLLTRDRARRLNVNVPPGAIESQEQLAHARQLNTRRDYGREIAARLGSPELSDSRTWDVVEAPLRIEEPLSDPEPMDGTEEEEEANRRAFAKHFIDQIRHRDGRDFRADFESGRLSLTQLRAFALNPLAAASTGSANYVPHTNPASLGQNVTATNTEGPSSIQVGPRPIATDWRGNNAWPGITIAPQAGTIVQSRFAGDGFDPPTNARQPPPLRHTDCDTIVPGTPHPMPQNDSVLPSAQSVAVPQVPSRTGNASVITTHPQTDLGRVIPVQPGEPSAMVPPMTPTAPRSRKEPPRLVRNPHTASQPVFDSKTTPGSAPVATPTRAAAPTGQTLTANHNNQNVGRGSNIRSGQGDIHFTTYNNASNLPSGCGPQATRKPAGQPGLPRPVHPQLPPQPQVASPASNPFLDSSHPNALLQGSMTGDTLPMYQDVPPPAGNGTNASHLAQPQAYPVDYHAARFAQSAQFTGSQLHSTMPQGASQPQVAYPQPPGNHPQPQSYAAQFHAPPALPAEYGPAQHIPRAPGHPFVLQYTQGHQDIPYPYGPQYGHVLHAHNGTYPVPYAPFGHGPGAQAAAHYQHFQSHMGPVPPPPAPAPIAPQFGYQAAPQFGPRGVAAPHEGVPAAPPGVMMDIDVGNGDAVADPAAGENVQNLQPSRPSVISSYPAHLQPILKTMVATGRTLSLASGTYLDYQTHDQPERTRSRENLARWCWNAANNKHQTNYPFKLEYMKPIDAAVCAARLAGKALLLSHGRHAYGLVSGRPQHNIEVKDRILPHGIHEGVPEEGRRPMESDHVKEGIRLLFFNNRRAIGVRHPEHFGPVPERALAYCCTLLHHLVFAHRNGEFENEPLNAIQQTTVFKIYMDEIQTIKAHNPRDLWNIRVRTWDYCMRGLVEPDPRPDMTPPPRVWSPDATELYTSEFASYLPPGALDAAPVLRAQGQQDPPAQDVSGEDSHGPLGPEDDGADEDEAEDEEAWEIVSGPGGVFYLVGPHHTAQVDSNVVDNILNGNVSAPEILAIAKQSAVPSTSQAGPSGLSNVEKEAIAQEPGIAHIEVVDSDDDDPEVTEQDPSDSQAPRLYNGRYLGENGGVERYDEGEDGEYFAGVDARRDIEPIVVTDEEMEPDEDD